MVWVIDRFSEIEPCEEYRNCVYCRMWQTARDVARNVLYQAAGKWVGLIIRCRYKQAALIRLMLQAKAPVIHLACFRPPIPALWIFTVAIHAYHPHGVPANHLFLVLSLTKVEAGSFKV